MISFFNQGCHAQQGKVRGHFLWENLMFSGLIFRPAIEMAGKIISHAYRIRLKTLH